MTPATERSAAAYLRRMARRPELLRDPGVRAALETAMREAKAANRGGMREGAGRPRTQEAAKPR